jgi:hypothetical protein
MIATLRLKKSVFMVALADGFRPVAWSRTDEWF